MNVKQVQTLVNSMASQMEGITGISANDMRGVVQLGNTVLASNTNVDKFLGDLADRIGTTILRILDLELEFPNLLRTAYEWGCVIQKINIQPVQAQSQGAWDVGNVDFTPTNFKIDKPIVKQTLITNAVAFEYDVTIPDTMLKTAFLSDQAFGAFIDGIMAALSDSMTIALNNLARGAIANLIAEKIKNGNGVIDVLAMFNAQFSKSYTSLQAAMGDKEFYRYTSMVIRNVIKYMSQPSALYNIGDSAGNPMIRATQRDNMHVFLSSDYVSGANSFLSADTFWKELVALPNYKEFVSLQGTGTGITIPTVANNTSINVIPASNASNVNTAVTASGIIGVIADREAIGIGLDDRFTATDRNNRNRYTNYTMGATLQYYNDLSENAVIICAVGGDLSLNKTSLTFESSAAEAQSVTATTTPAGQTVTWTTSDSSVATVSSGTVTPVGAGTCTITATTVIQGVTYKKSVEVTVGGAAAETKKKFK